MEAGETKPKHVITPANWRQYTDRIHQKSMEKAGIEIPSFEEAIFLGLAQAGEAGELANVIKKMWRDGQSEELFHKMVGEMADVLIYLDHLMNTFKLQATAVICKKVHELVNERHPEWFDDFQPTQVN